jgi:hypothetical protein
MVWGGVCSMARTDLHVFPRGTMNSTVYVTDILEQYVVPFAPFIGDNFIFQPVAAGLGRLGRQSLPKIFKAKMKELRLLDL